MVGGPVQLNTLNVPYSGPAYQCDSCVKSFSKKSGLSLHKRLK